MEETQQTSVLRYTTRTSDDDHEKRSLAQLYVHGLSMCCELRKVCAAFHVLWSVVYVTAGAVQLVAGIFFLISLPMFRVGSNIWTGAWNVLVGIGGGMLSCVGDLTAKRHEALLFLTISVLAVNVVNLVVLELGEWYLFLSEDTKHLLAQKNLSKLVFYAHVTTSVSTVVTIVTSFLDSQFTFYAMQNTEPPRNAHEQVSDIEYIIPRKKSSSVAKQAQSIYSQYAQSWVFDTDTTASSKNDSPYLKLPDDCNKDATITNQKTADIIECCTEQSHEKMMFLVNPIVHVEPVSDDSNGGRNLNYMKSFSRTPSPVNMSESSSPDSSINPPIYECLERLTEPTLYRSRLNTAISLNNDQSTFQSPDRKSPYIDQTSTFRSPGRLIRPRSETFTKDRLSVAESLDPTEKVQYASLMVELQQAFQSKKDKFHQPTSPQSACESVTVGDFSDRTHSESKASSQDAEQKGGSDAEFSKELEAALQLIQDLESPNTIETPSETCRSFDGNVPVVCVKWRDSDASESTKTVSECVSPSEFPEEHHGKRTSVVFVGSGSQSSSGYSSPSPGVSKHPTPLSGSASNLAAVPSHTTTTTIVAVDKSYLAPPLRDTDRNKLDNSKSRANRNSLQYQYEHLPETIFEDDTNTSYRSSLDSSSASTLRAGVSPTSSLGSSGTSRWSVKSLLRRKSSQPPVLTPELESAIFKSESLAYLTDLELLARHARNKSIQRQIELRVQQQILGLTPSESHC